MPRLFRNHPGYVAMSTTVLAISIGVNLLVFTFVNALWLRPLPFPEPERMVTIPRVQLARLDFFEPVFGGGVAGQVDTTEEFEGLNPCVEIGDGGPCLETLGVTPGYFKVLRLAVRGRDFSADDDRDGAEPVTIISDRLWDRAFGRRTGAVGAVLTVTPLPIKVIGVAPPGFEGARRGEKADLWIPTSLVRRLAPPEWTSQGLPLMLFGRLGPGQSVPALQQRLQSLAPRLFSHAALTPISDVFGTPDSATSEIKEGSSLLLVSVLALLVLLCGCTTIAALVLTHYERRRAELALRMSLGAGRRRLVFELVRDLSSVAVTGTATGIIVAVVGIRVMPALSLPGGVNIGRLDLSIDWRVCAVAIAATLVTLTFAAGLPLARATRLRLAGELLAGPSANTLGSLRVRQALLAVQVCTTIIVLIAAGLFVRTVLHAFASAPGFDVERTVFVSIQEGAPFVEEASDRAARAARVMLALKRVPRVSEVAEGIAPIGSLASRSLPGPRTVKVRDGAHDLLVGVLTGSPNLLSALGVQILVGRPLNAADLAPAIPYPAVITRSLAERLWPQGRALGETLSLPQLRRSRYLVVGIARDFAFGSLARPGSGVVVAAAPGNSAGLVSNYVIRADHPEILSGMVSRAVRGQVVHVATGRQVVAQDIGRQRLGAWLFSGFGLAALLLGVIGAFGLVAYLAESRRREFGVRLALGADTSDLVRHGLSAAMRPVSTGVAAGLAIGGLVSRLFSAFLVGISALDGITYVSVAAMMLSCAAIAALVAAWRLHRTCPSDALRAT